MKMNARTFRPPVPCRLHLFVIASLVVGFAVKMPAQSIQQTVENGRIVWTNDGPAQSAASAKARAKAHGRTKARYAQSTELVYWSNVENRWKPVPLKSTAAMRSARAAASEVSSYIDSHQKLQRGAKSELAEQDIHYSRTAEDRTVSTAQIDKYIDDAAARNHVDPNLVRALVKVESNFNPNAVSRKGAMGLMQLMPATARQYDVHNPFDAAQNVEAGVRHLKGLLENFGGDVRLSLAAYNAGAGAVTRSGGIPPYAETRNYVKRITNLMGDGAEMHFSSLSFPIHVNRDEHGRLVISNVD